jgi:hypothetical protein
VIWNHMDGIGAYCRVEEESDSVLLVEFEVDSG